MPITVNQSPSFGAYGGMMADAARQEEYMKQLNPFIQQYFGQEFQSGEAGKQRSFQGAESALDRALRESLQTSQQTWQSTESAAERALREKMQQEMLAKQYQPTYSTVRNQIQNTVGTPMGFTAQKYKGFF